MNRKFAKVVAIILAVLMAASVFSVGIYALFAGH